MKPQFCKLLVDENEKQAMDLCVKFDKKFVFLSY